MKVPDNQISSKTSVQLTKPILVIILGLFSVSTASIFIRFAQLEASSIVIAAYRLTLASLILAPIVWKKNIGEIKNLEKKQWVRLVLSGLFLAIHFASWILSLEYTSVVESVILVSTTPLWVAILSPLLLKEKSTSIVWVGMMIAMVGGGIVGMSDICQFGSEGLICMPMQEFMQGKSSIGNFLALVGAWGAAGYLMIGRKARPSLSILSYIFLVYSSAAIFLLFGVFFSGESLIGYSPNTYIFFLALAIIPQLLGHSAFNWSLRYLPATFVSVCLLGEPIGTSILAFIILGETISPIVLIGGVLILAGVFLVSGSQD